MDSPTVFCAVAKEAGAQKPVTPNLARRLWRLYPFEGRIESGIINEMSNEEFETNPDKPGYDDFISLREASEISGLSPDHLRRLAGRGDLWAKKIGRDWLTTIRAINEYLARDRRPGPKKNN